MRNQIITNSPSQFSRMLLTITTLSAFLSMLLVSGLAKSSDDPVIAVNKVMNEFHLAASQSEYETYFNMFTDDAYFLGTDASERWSLDEFKHYAKPAFDGGKGWHYDVIERNVKIRDDVAWFDEQLDNSHLGRCRGTGVLIKTATGWKIEHYSLTLLVPNQIADKVGAESMALMNPTGKHN